MDKVGADFAMCVQSIRNRLSPDAVPIQIPVGEASEFEGIINLVNMKYYTYEGDNGEKQVEHDIPEHMQEKAKEAREEMIDAISLFDDALAEKFLEGEALTEEEVKNALRTGVTNNKIYPVMCGSALRNAGVQLMLDAAVDFLPSPVDVGTIH